ncbi:MAG: hypothetical protein AAGC69_19270, partial [Paracraurococcus sp.]
RHAGRLEEIPTIHALLPPYPAFRLRKARFVMMGNKCEIEPMPRMPVCRAFAVVSGSSAVPPAGGEIYEVCKLYAVIQAGSPVIPSGQGAGEVAASDDLERPLCRRNRLCAHLSY